MHRRPDLFLVLYGITTAHFSGVLFRLMLMPPFCPPPPTKPPPPGALFLVLYGITAAYFSGVMVRLMLVLAPAVCCLAGVALSDILTTLCCSLKAHGPVLPLPSSLNTPEASTSGAATPGAKGGARRGGKGASDAGEGGQEAGSFPGISREWNPLPKVVALAGFVGILVLMVQYTVHCIG